MTSEILTACSSAKDSDGMLTIHAAFSRLQVPTLPVVLPELCIAVRICSSSSEDGQHSLQLSLSDLDGKILGPPAKADFLTKTKDNEALTWTVAVIRVADIRISEPNEYLLNLQIDGKSIATTTLYVVGRTGI